MTDFSVIIKPERIRDISSSTKAEALSEISSIISSADEVVNPKGFLHAILHRERVMSTGIGMGVAIPHARTPFATDLVMAIGRSKKGVDFESLDGKPVHIIIMMGTPDRKKEEFLLLIAKIGSLFNQTEFKSSFLEAETSDDMYRLIIGKLNNSRPDASK